MTPLDDTEDGEYLLRGADEDDTSYLLTIVRGQARLEQQLSANNQEMRRVVERLNKINGRVGEGEHQRAVEQGRQEQREKSDRNFKWAVGAAFGFLAASGALYGIIQNL